MLYHSAGPLDVLSLAANTVLLLGCAYEAWAVRILSGQPVKRQIHILVSTGIILVASTTIFFKPPFGSGLIFLLQSTFYFLPGLFLLGKTGITSSLQLIFGVCYFIGGGVFFVAALLSLGFPEYTLNLGRKPIAGIIPITSFCLLLISGFILLMLAKERSDMQVAQMQKSLEKSEMRFQRIVETAIEGILIFDEDYNITFTNQNMASVLGYTIEEMVGRSCFSFFPLKTWMMTIMKSTSGPPAKVWFMNAASLEKI